jgi:hypothetical protein
LIKQNIIKVSTGIGISICKKNNELPEFKFRYNLGEALVNESAWVCFEAAVREAGDRVIQCRLLTLSASLSILILS